MTTSAHIEALEQRRMLTVIAPNPNFGTDGVVTLLDGNERIFPYNSIRTIVQVDGDKLLLVGDEGAVVFYRLNADGSADTSFGQNGTVSFENNTYDVLNVAVLEDQKLIVEMFNYNVEDGRLELWRFNADGTRDVTFGQGGIVEPAIHQVIGTTGLVVDAAGKIFLGATLPHEPGATSGPDSLDTFAIERFNPDGTLDTSFGDGGIFRRTDATGVQAMALDAQGRVLAVGLSDDESHQLFTSELFRFLPSGQLDTTFASGGIVEVNFEDEEPGSMVQVAPDGKIVLVKQSSVFGGGFRIDRFDSDGSPDETFGEQGEIGQADVGVRDLFISPSGGITAALQVIDGRPYFRRYNADGSVDTSFNDEGAVLIDLAEGDFPGPALVLDADTIVYEIENDRAAPRLIELASRTPGQSLHDGVLTIIGGDLADTISITRTGNTITATLNNTPADYDVDQVKHIAIFSGDGEDSVTGSEADDDMLITAAGSILVDTRGGDDVVHLTGRATINGGDGDDTLIAHTAGGTLFGDAGDDFIRAASSAEIATWVYGGYGNDTLFAGDGDDTLIGGGQRDRLYAGGGNDFLLGCGGNDRLFGGGGADTLQGARGNDYLAGFDGNDTLIAGPGNNILHGDDGDDAFLAQNSQADELFGDEGTNTAVELDPELDVLSDVAST